MKRDARNSATVSAVAPRFNSSAWRARISFFLTLSLSFSLFLSLFISAGGMTERVLSSRYMPRAPRRADRFVAGNYGTRSGRHIACRTRVGALMRGLRDPPVPAPQAAGVVRVSLAKSRDCDMTRRCHTVWAWAPIRLEWLAGHLASRAFSSVASRRAAGTARLSDNRRFN